MRPGWLLLAGAVVAVLGLAGAGIWLGQRLVQEPDIPAAVGSPEDDIRGQQKIFDIVRGDPFRSGGGSRQVVVTEAELNRFLSRHFIEVAKMSVTGFAVRLVGEGLLDFKGLLPLSSLLSASPLAGLVPATWLERRVWLYMNVRASLEVGAGRSRRRHLRFDVQHFGIGRQPLPGILLQLLPSSGLQSLLRWRVPESVEGITVESGAVVIKASS